MEREDIMAVSLVKAVSLRKSNPVVAGVRLSLRSDVLAHVDVIRRADGTVWAESRRLPGRESLDGSPVVRVRQSGAFREVLHRVSSFEDRGGHLTGARLLV